MIWREEYNLGVEHIDKQHRGLFKMVERITGILEQDDLERNRWACIEGIKYLKSYALTHFADEEAYQRSIDYENYAVHKLQHDAFVETVLHLEQDMVECDFSRPSIERFVGTLTSWLLYHIVNSDQAIVRKKQPTTAAKADKVQAIEGIVAQITQEVFHVELQVSDYDYQGGLSGSELFCLARCTLPAGGTFDFLFAANTPVMLRIVRGIVDMPVNEVNELVTSAIEELVTLMAMHYMGGGEVDMVNIFHKDRLEQLRLPDDMLCSLLFESSFGTFLIRAWEK